MNRNSIPFLRDSKAPKRAERWCTHGERTTAKQATAKGLGKYALVYSRRLFFSHRTPRPEINGFSVLLLKDDLKNNFFFFSNSVRGSLFF